MMVTFDQWWDKETEAIGRKGMGRNGVFYQLAKRAWVAAERKEREACAKVCESFGGNGSGYIDDDWAAMCANAIRAR
jgi:hypothetical protein